MPVELDAEVDTSRVDRRLRVLRGEAAQDVFASFAEALFEQYRDGWPVDTGLSKRGLRYRLFGRGLRMRFTNRWAYAVWVERRWYPVREHADVRSAIAAVNRDTALAARLNRR